MSIALCMIFVCLYRANLAAYGIQNIVDISSADNWLGTTHNSLIMVLHNRMESSALNPQQIVVFCLLREPPVVWVVQWMCLCHWSIFCLFHYIIFM